MDDLTLIKIAMIGAVTAIVIAYIICKTIITLQKGKNERVRHTHETEKAIAETLAKSSTNYNIETTHLSAKKHDTEDEITYVNESNKESLPAFLHAISTAALDHWAHSKKGN